jgi:hypothetical protein
VKYFEITEFPNFIFQDESFLTSAICDKCAPDFYLNQNVCVAVPGDSLITNCVEYESETTCRRCGVDLILSKER